jgi:hypothetical protein
MGVGTYTAYIVLSIALTIAVGTALARSGRVYLQQALGGDQALARAVSRLLVLGFYLFTLGFVALAMQPPGAVTSLRQAAQLVSVKIGEVLLVLGAAHLISLAVFRRFGRRGPARRPGPDRRPAGPERRPAVELPRPRQDVH